MGFITDLIFEVCNAGLMKLLLLAKYRDKIGYTFLHK